MAPRRTTVEPDDPIDDVMQMDRAHTADALMEAIEQVQGFDSGNVKAILYKIERGGGKYTFISDYFPPFDMVEIFKESRKPPTNGGDFCFRIFVENKIRKNVMFSVQPGPAEPVHKPDASAEMLPLLLQMMQSSGDKQMQMMLAMMQQGQAAQQQQTQMMVAMVTAMMGNQQKASDMIPLIAAMREGSGDKGGVKETLELMTAAKGLFGEGGGSFDPEDMVGSIAKIAGPVMGAVGSAFAARKVEPAGTPNEVYTPNPSAAPLALPSQSVAIPDQMASRPATEIDLGRFPALTRIRDDVLFFFERRYDPELAADAIADRVEALGIPEGEINDIVAQIGNSADPFGDLAASGLDLRADLGWAMGFFSALARFRDDADAVDDGGDGDQGGEADLAADGVALPERVAAE